MGTPKLPRPPAGAQQAGRRLWRAVLGDYELAEHELVLLREAVAVVDVCHELQGAVAAHGPMVDGKANPALVGSCGCSGNCWVGCWRRCGCRWELRRTSLPGRASAQRVIWLVDKAVGG
ncbi:MAG: hypothetical protein ACR2KO_09280 [Geodermatophilaceae bacterium]